MHINAPVYGLSISFVPSASIDSDSRLPGRHISDVQPVNLGYRARVHAHTHAAPHILGRIARFLRPNERPQSPGEGVLCTGSE